MSTAVLENTDGTSRTLIDDLLAEQRNLTAVDRFARWHENHDAGPPAARYQNLIPLNSPRPGEQYAFEVDLDKCSGCKACVAGCHSLNGLDENETWRETGLLHGGAGKEFFQQTITSACHHCIEPGCLNGCPVKAYDKDPVTGIVRHLDDQCMGCQYCVMKCPYEVPKYSKKLGIVRKCDMCHQRLAHGEAPACVQSCPNEAIKITLVKQSETKELFYNGQAQENFLPDSPHPKITFPATRYLSRRALTGLVFAADGDQPRLDQPHWPLIVMLVFTQAAVGVFVMAAVVPASPILLLTAFLLMNIGLLAAPLHLGRPLKAWRAFLGWRTSWLSRELIAFNLFAPVAAAATIVAWLSPIAKEFTKVADLLHKLPAIFMPLEKWQWPLTLAAALIGAGCVAVSAMVYVDTKRAFWSPIHSFGAFFGTVLLSGAAVAAFVLALTGFDSTARSLAISALTVRVALFIWRRLEIHFAFQDPDRSIHLNARAVRELLPRSSRADSILFIVSIICGAMAMADGPLMAIWAGAMAATILSSEISGRYLFFRAGAGRKMPGGIAT
ncbi:MAG TPA: DmsC/YnfH family molybdoenzyme membrane anchor subunit [Verrucomicrobiae bacterium]|nr:DmsC/YnfH family molybdoenzyme membrane anchor subunit [Verrucomicrobiae bacterium]